MVNNISIDELSKIIDNINLIDIRTLESYNNGHIKNAKNIPSSNILITPDKFLNKNSVYYIYCQKGHKSIKVCQILNSLGYKTINVTGGYESWILNK